MRVLPLLIMFLLFGVFTEIVYSSPAPIQFVLNHETKQCGTYWAGDEFVVHELSKGWKICYIKSDGNIVEYLNETETVIGTCNISSTTNPYSLELYEECCNQIGYTWTNESTNDKSYTTEFGKRTISYEQTKPLLSALILIVVVALFFYLLKRGMKKK